MTKKAQKAPNYIQGRGITSHFHYKNFDKHSRQVMPGEDTERRQIFLKSSDAQTSTLHVHLKPLKSINTKNNDLKTALLYSKTGYRGSVKEPDTAVSNLTMQYKQSTDVDPELAKQRQTSRNLGDNTQY